MAFRTHTSFTTWPTSLLPGWFAYISSVTGSPSENCGASWKGMTSATRKRKEAISRKSHRFYEILIVSSVVSFFFLPLLLLLSLFFLHLYKPVPLEVFIFYLFLRPLLLLFHSTVYLFESGCAWPGALTFFLLFIYICTCICICICSCPFFFFFFFFLPCRF